MSWEDDLFDDLRRDEGSRTKPYKDTVGKLTIGVGRNLDDVGLRPDEIFTLLQNDVNGAKSDLDRVFPWWRDKPDAVKRGLLNMTFNVGIGRLCGFKKMLDALKDGRYDEAADEALNSRWAEQVGSRAVRVASLFRSLALVA